MKNSGIEWQEEIQKEIPFIESIPKNWRLIPNRWLFKEDGNKVGADWAKYQLLSLTTTGVKERNIDDVGGKVPTSYDNYQTVKKGQMIFCLFDLDCSAVFSGISKYNGMITSAYDVFSSTDLITNNYIDYWFRYVFSNRYYMMYSKNIRYSVTSDIFKGLKTPVPPITEQQKIADILDEKCGKIDKLIENEQKQIEKMKEYKQSVITSAVTKGLDKSAPLKDSGIEYFEMIPAIWETAKTLNVLETPITDGPHTTPNLYEDGIPFISAEAIKNGKINFELKRGYISQEFYDECCLKYIPKLHDIYMIKSGATTGNVACVETEEIFTIWSPLAVFRCNEKLMKYRYLYYFLQSKPYQQQIQLKWSFGTQQNIGMRVLETLKLLIPPIEEQKQIVDYLDEKCGKIDEVISIKQRKIEKLQEYKKSLIYEYVTGKKEVV